MKGIFTVILLAVIGFGAYYYIEETDHGRCHVLNDKVACAKQGAKDLMKDVEKATK